MQLSLTLSFSIKISQEKNHSVYTIVLIQTIKENRKNNLLYFFCHDQLRNKIKQTKLKFLPAVNLLRFNILIHTTLAVKKNVKMPISLISRFNAIASALRLRYEVYELLRRPLICPIVLKKVEKRNTTGEFFYLGQSKQRRKSNRENNLNHRANRSKKIHFRFLTRNLLVSKFLEEF